MPRITRPATIVAAVVVSTFDTAPHAAEPARAPGAVSALEAMPPGLEARFALAAVPPHLRAGATVFLLDPKSGYVLHRKGSNGFTCLVERTEWARADFRDDIYTPLCYDAEGAKNHLRVWMDVAAMRARGLGPEAVRDAVRKGYAEKRYRPPSRAGISYMVAPLMRTYPTQDLADRTVVTMSMPHLMFYAAGLTDADIGGAPPPSPYPFIFEQGPHGYMIVLVGQAEREGILRDEARLVADLCAYRSLLCLPGTPAPH